MASENLLLMRETLASKQARINKRYKFYDMKNTTPDFGISTPRYKRSFKQADTHKKDISTNYR